MPHYYLNVINGSGLTRDREGEDFPDLHAAREKAAESVRSILSDELRSAGMINLRGRIEIVDLHGAVMLTLPFREAVQLMLEDAPPGREGQ
jgi:hypothetical protein